jgi:hypothetical protein
MMAATWTWAGGLGAGEPCFAVRGRKMAGQSKAGCVGFVPLRPRPTVVAAGEVCPSVAVRGS